MSHSTKAQPALMTVKEASAYLNISERHLWEMTTPRGSIPCVKIGRTVRYHLPHLDAYIDMQRTAQATGGAR